MARRDGADRDNDRCHLGGGVHGFGRDRGLRRRPRYLLAGRHQEGALRVVGTSYGPDPDALRFVSESLTDTAGFWVFLPQQAFMTGFDDPPPS